MPLLIISLIVSTSVGGDRDSSSYKHDIEIADNPAYATVGGDRDTGGSSSKDIEIADNPAYAAMPVRETQFHLVRDPASQ